MRPISIAALLLLGALPLGAIFAEATPTSTGNPPTESAPADPMSTASEDQPAPIFDALDTNRDGYVTKEEAKRSADVTARYKELDTNCDGRISSREFIHGKL